MFTGYIYIIFSEQHNNILVYIGSTKLELADRLQQHELNLRKYNRGKYNYVFKLRCIKSWQLYNTIYTTTYVKKMHPLFFIFFYIFEVKVVDTFKEFWYLKNILFKLNLLNYV